MSALNKLLKLYDSKAACARSLEITPQKLNGWVKLGYIPFRHGRFIEDKTNKKVKAHEVWSSAGIDSNFKALAD